MSAANRASSNPLQAKKSEDDNFDDNFALKPWLVALRADAKKNPGPMRANLPVRILPHLYLGDCECARNLENLSRLKITHVLNVAGRGSSNSDLDFGSAGIEHFDVDALDEDNYEMLDLHLNFAREVFERARKANGICLVHCRQGMNRSGVLAAAEVILFKRITVLDAVNKCRLERGTGFLSNSGFQKQLILMSASESLLGPEPLELKPTTPLKPLKPLEPLEKAEKLEEPFVMPELVTP